jgi:hypothetical protein
MILYVFLHSVKPSSAKHGFFYVVQPTCFYSVVSHIGIFDEIGEVVSCSSYCYVCQECTNIPKVWEPH